MKRLRQFFCTMGFTNILCWRSFQQPMLPSTFASAVRTPVLQHTPLPFVQSGTTGSLVDNITKGLDLRRGDPLSHNFATDYLPCCLQTYTCAQTWVPARDLVIHIMLLSITPSVPQHPFQVRWRPNGQVNSVASLVQEDRRRSWCPHHALALRSAAQRGFRMWLSYDSLPVTN